MSSATPRNSVYASYVFSNIVSSLSQGQGAYNVNDLAAAVGLKPTHNFRRRLKQMVEAGQLREELAFSPNNGTQAIYSLPASEPTLEQPSW